MEPQAIPAQEASSSSVTERLMYYGLLALTGLLPLFFWPDVTVGYAKTILIVVLTAFVSIVWLFAKLRHGSFTFRDGLLSRFAIAAPIVYLASAAFSSSFSQAFFGTSFEIGTAISLVLGFVLLLLSLVTFKTREKIFIFYAVFLGSFFIVALFQLIRLFGGSIMQMGVFTAPQINLIGKWNELAIYFGLSALVSVLTLEFLKLGRALKVLAAVALVISLFFLGVIGFTYVFYVVGVLSLVSVVYWVAFNKAAQADEFGITKSWWKRITLPSLLVLLVSIIFIADATFAESGKPSFIRSHFPEKLLVSQAEFSPSFMQTVGVAQKTWKENPVFGTGPNTFANQWLAHKPSDVNSTIFWNVDFAYGVGTIPTIAVAGGLLSALAWLGFLIAFLYLGLQTIFTRKDTIGQYIAVSSFFAALYLWVFQMIYLPSQVLFVLAFMFTGVFMSAAAMDGKLRERVFVYTASAKKHFLVVLVILFALAATVATTYVSAQKMYAGNLFFKGVATAAASNGAEALQKTEGYFKRAIKLDENDVYYRALIDLNAAKINAILNQQNVPQETMRTQFQTVFPEMLAQVQRSIAINPSNYQNWLILGRVYSGVLPLGYPGAYDKAIEAYTSAAKYNPTSPLIPLERARLEVLNNNTAKAREEIGKALTLKANYLDAVYLLSQIEIAANNIPAATQSVEAAVFLNPNDPSTLFQLGVLRYSAQNFKGAVEALERAIALTPVYANARYFLALSYAQLNREQDALAQLLEVQKTNTDNKDVEQMIKNLRIGKSIFTAPAPAPTATKPVKGKPAKSLPVKEQTPKGVKVEN